MNKNIIFQEVQKIIDIIFFELCKNSIAILWDTLFFHLWY